jgi:DNA-binding response OmpR family regulator
LVDPNTGQPTILIVDDSPFILQLLETVFETEGFSPRCATDAASALREAQAETPDVVLLDVRMPEVDGWEVLRRLRERDEMRHVPVAMTSTDREELGLPLALGRDAQAYVMKPFSPGTVVDAMRQLLRAPASVCQAD